MSLREKFDTLDVSPMNLKQIETFVWLARLSSFRETAKHLRTTQPAISARIRELEEALGVPLFTRTSRRVRLSRQGSELLRYAERIAGLAAELQERAGNLGSIQGLVRIGATHAVATGWLPKLLKLLSAEYKGIEVMLRVDMSTTIYQQLLRNEIDLAFLLGPIAHPSHSYLPLGSIDLGWIAGPGVDRLPATVTPADLANVPVVTDAIGSSLHRICVDWFRGAGVEPRVLHTCAGLLPRAQLIQAGFGVGILPAAAPELYRQLTRLRRLTSDPPLPKLEYGMAYHLGDMPAAVRTVVRLTREKLKDTIGDLSL